jgi:hypothetical protein
VGRMAEAPPRYTGRSAQLSHSVEATVNDLDKISRFGLSADWETLKRSARRWTKSFETLEEFNPEGTGAEEEPTVFSILTSGMDETLDKLRRINNEKTPEQSPQRIERLEARIAYHAKSVALISAYFER